MPRKVSLKRSQPEITAHEPAAAVAATVPLFTPPQRAPVRRDMTASLKIGVFPSEVDCAGCERLCGSLPHSWRNPCLATCRSACAVGHRVASVGQAIGLQAGAIGRSFASSFA